MHKSFNPKYLMQKNMKLIYNYHLWVLSHKVWYHTSSYVQPSGNFIRITAYLYHIQLFLQKDLHIQSGNYSVVSYLFRICLWVVSIQNKASRLGKNNSKCYCNFSYRYFAWRSLTEKSNWIIFVMKNLRNYELTVNKFRSNNSSSDASISRSTKYLKPFNRWPNSPLMLYIIHKFDLNSWIEIGLWMNEKAT